VSNLKHWKKKGSKIISKNPFWTYKQDEFEIPDGPSGFYYYVHTNGSSMVVPIKDNKIVMVKQYRYLCNNEVLEFPCGGVKDGASFLDTARHELTEETGYRAKNISEAGQFLPFNGISNEVCKVFVARELEQVGSNPDDTEEFEVHEYSFDDIEKMIVDKKIHDGMTLAAWAMVRSNI